MSPYKHIKTRRGADAAVRLGDVIEEILRRRIEPRHLKLQAVRQAWDSLLPDELSRHCRPVELAGGSLKVAVDSPSHLYELRLVSGAVLEQLRRSCSSANVRQIRPVLG
jgi:hypothetical protein